LHVARSLARFRLKV